MDRLEGLIFNAVTRAQTKQHVWFSDRQRIAREVRKLFVVDPVTGLMMASAPEEEPNGPTG